MFMSLLVADLRLLEKSPRVRDAHVRREPSPTRGVQAWERKGSPDSMSNKSGHWAWEFAMQRRARLLAYAKKVCRNANEAEDLVQETTLRFGEAFKMVAEPRPVGVCESWMITTMDNLFFGLCRKRKVQEAGAQEPSLRNEIVLPPEHSRETLSETITPERLAAALPKLSPKLRETFELHAAGKSYQEISQELGIPVGTVAKRLYDARVKLRELLQGPTDPGVN